MLRNRRLRDLQSVKNLCRAGTDRVAENEIPGGIKLIGGKRQPISQRHGDIGRGQHVISSVGSAIATAEQKRITG